jgi:HlyD family secretion protein
MSKPIRQFTLATPSDLEETLQIGVSHQKKRRFVRVILILLLLGIAAGAYFLFARKRPQPAPRFETAEVIKGDLHVTITATGTLSARDSVPVGAEISGRVVKVLVDINDKVTKGQILAEIDPEQYRARLNDANAQLALARASRLTAQATAHETELKTARLRSMQNSGLSSVQDLETAEAGLSRAMASLKTASAQINSADASLKLATSNLAKTTIRSPIDGVVLERSVEPGQTVTSGLQTFVLFTLAADLSEMRLAVKIDEADVGQVKPGQNATFTVDAYPNRIFESKVIRVKNLPTTAQNVVTYETQLSVKNNEHLLRPGMTATATIIIEDLNDVFLVPNAALRFNPKTKSRATNQESKEFNVSRLLARGPGPGLRRNQGANQGGQKPKVVRMAKKPTIYLLRGSEPEELLVEIGATDGINTAISSPGITVGTKIIIGEMAQPNG